MTKICCRCNIPKPLLDFYKVPKNSEKIDSWCKQCRRLYQTRYAAYHRENSKKYRATHPEARKRWREQNTDHLREYERERYYKDRARYARLAKERKLKMGKIPGSHSEQEWTDLLFAFQYKCYGCGVGNVKLTKDHIVPVSKNGVDFIQNIIPLCRSCNSKKSNKGPEWYVPFWKKLLLESAFEKPVDSLSSSGLG